MKTATQRLELNSKIHGLVLAEYGGDWTRAFRHYSSLEGNKQGVDHHQLTELLKDADVGDCFTRAVWADEILADAGMTERGSISEDVFDDMLRP